MVTDARGLVGQVGNLQRVVNPLPDAGMRASQRRLPVGAQDSILPHTALRASVQRSAYSIQLLDQRPEHVLLGQTELRLENRRFPQKIGRHSNTAAIDRHYIPARLNQVETDEPYCLTSASIASSSLPASAHLPCAANSRYLRK